jgi:hypothetical protein
MSLDGDAMVGEHVNGVLVELDAIGAMRLGRS